MNKLRIINKRGRFYPQSETFFIWNSFFDEKTLDEIYFSILSEAERWIDYYLYRWG